MFFDFPIGHQEVSRGESEERVREEPFLERFSYSIVFRDWNFSQFFKDLFDSTFSSVPVSFRCQNICLLKRSGMSGGGA